MQTKAFISITHQSLHEKDPAVVSQALRAEKRHSTTVWTNFILLLITSLSTALNKLIEHTLSFHSSTPSRKGPWNRI